MRRLYASLFVLLCLGLAAKVISQASNIPQSEPIPGREIILTVLFLACAVIYFIPALVAKNREHKDTNSIFVVNLFLGWTIIGWIVALAWAVKSAGANPKLSTPKA